MSRKVDDVLSQDIVLILGPVMASSREFARENSEDPISKLGQI